jgi:hypothetical protein
MTAGGVAPFNHDPGPYRKNIDRRPVSADLIRESVEVFVNPLPDYSVVVFQPASRWIFGRWQARVKHLPSKQALYSKHLETPEEAKQVAAKLLMDLVAWVAKVREQYRREGVVGNLSTPDEIIEHYRRRREEP